MVGTIRLSGKDYRWVYGVRASHIYQTMFGKIQEETDTLKAFEVNVKFLYSCHFHQDKHNSLQMNIFYQV